MNLNRLTRRRGRVYSSSPCRAKIPGREAFDYYAVNRHGNPDYRRPLRWVDDAPDDPEDFSGHWEYA